jgi:hypothetical protein
LPAYHYFQFNLPSQSLPNSKFILPTLILFHCLSLPLMEEEKGYLLPDPVSPDNPIPLFVVIFTLIIIQCIVHVWKAKHFR